MMIEEKQQIGRLTVIYLDHIDKMGNNYWKCQCDCGRNIIAYEPALLYGIKKDCGRHHIEIDLTGYKTGKLTVIQKIFKRTNDNKPIWECLCDCGQKTYVIQNQLVNGSTKSCGCLRPEQSKRFFSGIRQENIRLYRIWMGVKGRCNSPTHKDYYLYGGRGIKLYSEWEQYEPFYNWAMSHGYQDDLSIDRIDTNGNYEPDNCRWADIETQSYNRRNNIRYLIDGEIKTLKDLANESGLSRNTLYRRIECAGWDIKRAMTTPVRKIKKT